MAKKEYIEREAVLLAIDIHGTNKFGMLDEDIREFIKRQPAANVVEVVRCKDCVNFKQSVSALFPESNCFICDSPYGMKRNVEETGFCSCGERMIE